MNSELKSWLLLHGLTGTPQELSPLQQALEKMGMHTVAPMLPGHGTDLAQLAKTSLEEWKVCVSNSLKEPSHMTSPRIVVGASLGGLLGIYLALSQPKMIKALVLLAPPFKLRSPLKERFAGTLSFLPDNYLNQLGTLAKSKLKEKMLELKHTAYEKHSIPAVAKMFRLRREVLASLRQIKCPVLLIYDPQDYNVCTQAYGEMKLPSNFENFEVKDGGHELLLGRQRQLVIDKILSWCSALNSTNYQNECAPCQGS